MSDNLISNVMDPTISRIGGMPETAFLPQTEYTMADRLDSLDNKTVYLVDTGFPMHRLIMINQYNSYGQSEAYKVKF